MRESWGERARALTLIVAALSACGGGQTSAPGLAADSGVDSAGGPQGGNGGHAGSQSAFIWQRPNNPPQPRGIWGSSSGDVYAVESRLVWHGRAAQFSSTTVGTQDVLAGVWGSSPSRILTLNAGGEIYESAEDQQWSTAAAVTAVVDAVSFVGLWGIGDSLFAFGNFDDDRVGAGAVFRQLADSSWASVSAGFSGGLAEQIIGMWGSSTTDLYACSLHAVYHYRGSSWLAEPAVGCLSISGSSASDVYIASHDGVLHSTGDGNWSNVPVFWRRTESPSVIFAVSASAVFMGTTASGVYFFDGAAWSQIGDLTHGSHELMWAPSADEVYISGLDGFWFGKRR